MAGKKDRRTISARSEGLVVGNIAPRETHESGGAEEGDGARRTIVKEGDYVSLEAAQPARGDSWADMPDWAVDSSRLTRRRGGLGRLTVVLVPRAALFGNFIEQELRSRIEIDFVQYERPILSHPTLNTGENNCMAIHLRRWMDCGMQVFPDFPYKDGQGDAHLTEAEQAWAKLILKGVESFLEFAPVVVRIRTYRGRPDVEAPGKISDPPEGGPDGFEYLKTADRLVQNEDRSWTRTEQWTGALKWETLLYEA